MKVFLSYALPDRGWARRFAEQLGKAGRKAGLKLDVWDPEDELRPGDNWAESVRVALDKADETQGGLPFPFQP